MGSPARFRAIDVGCSMRRAPAPSTCSAATCSGPRRSPRSGPRASGSSWSSWDCRWRCRWPILALFAGFIPYVGGFVATALAFLVAVAVGDSTTIVIMFIYTIVFNIVQGNFVTPLVYGKAVSLHPAIVLLAVPIGNALAGIVGMFLVVPVAGVIATTWRAVLQTIDAGDVVVPERPR